jgi:hypothetical protein
MIPWTDTTNYFTPLITSGHKKLERLTLTHIYTVISIPVRHEGDCSTPHTRKD